MFDIVQMERGNRVQIDRARDENLTTFGKATLTDRYLMPEEDYQGLFGRVSMTYGDDSAHAQRLYDYMSKLWFMPSTPILSNGGTSRGLPISCFLNETGDSLEDILELWNENVRLASLGGGIGSYWGNVRSIGEKIGRNGKTSGIIPFIRVMDCGAAPRRFICPSGIRRLRNLSRFAVRPAGIRTVKHSICIRVYS
jgi:ribonucleoside-diphosphate reductase alpha chain